ncbi:hypothetical protein, partial [Acidianus sp. RZ1]
FYMNQEKASLNILLTKIHVARDLVQKDQSVKDTLEYLTTIAKNKCQQLSSLNTEVKEKISKVEDEISKVEKELRIKKGLILIDKDERVRDFKEAEILSKDIESVNEKLSSLKVQKNELEESVREIENLCGKLYSPSVTLSHHPPQKFIECPKCGSNSIHMETQFDLRGDTTSLFKCKDCGNTWRQS